MSDEGQGAADGAGANDDGLAGGKKDGGKSDGGNLAEGGAKHSGDTPEGQKTGWYAAFGEGLDADTAKGFNSWASRYEGPAQFAKAAVELRKSHDARIPVPDFKDPKASQSWWEKHGEKLGRPADPKEYEFSWDDNVAGPLEDAEKDALEQFKSVHHRNGGSKQSFAEYVKWEQESRKVVNDARAAKATKIQGDRRRELERDWQFDFERNVNVYATTVNHYGQEDAQTFKQLRLEDGTLVQNHPAVARMLTRVGRERMEDDRDLNDFNRQARVGPMEQIEKIEADLEAKYGPTSKWPKDQQEKLTDLYKQAYGGRAKSPHQMHGRS